MCCIGALPRICTYIQLSVNIYCGPFCTRFVPVVCTLVDSLVSRVGATWRVTSFLFAFVQFVILSLFGQHIYREKTLWFWDALSLCTTRWQHTLTWPRSVHQASADLEHGCVRGGFPTRIFPCVFHDQSHRPRNIKPNTVSQITGWSKLCFFFLCKLFSSIFQETHVHQQQPTMRMLQDRSPKIKRVMVLIMQWVNVISWLNGQYDMMKFNNKYLNKTHVLCSKAKKKNTILSV